MEIEICTLGDFDIKRDNYSAITKRKRAHKNIELLAYFIANHGKKISCEDIIDTFWGDSHQTDPQNALRTQVFRLRQLLKEAGLYNDGLTPNQGFDISFENGFYIFTTGDHCRFDIENFERFVKAGNLLKDEKEDEAIEFYMKAARLYKGDFVAGTINSEWVVYIRSHYHRLYIQTILRLFSLLKKSGRWREIIEYFEPVVMIEPLEESIHLYYLESLINLGEYRNALSHYNYITDRFKREIAAKPSPAFKNFYSKIIAGEKNAEEADIYTIRRELLTEENKSGAMFCDLEYFKVIYNIEERKRLREGSNALVGLISIDSPLDDGKLETYLDALKSILSTSLRKGDVFSQWNKRQLILLLLNTGQENIDQISRRIINRFYAEKERKGIDLCFSFEPFFKKQPVLNL